jgi:PAS domain-containing protein
MRLDRPKLRATASWRRSAAGAARSARWSSSGAEGPRAVALDLGHLEYARDLARQLSAAVENVQLLDDILRQRRLLEDTFNSLVDLVAVMDKELRIVQTNDAFAARVGLKRSEVMRRPLRELVGPRRSPTSRPPTPGRASSPRCSGASTTRRSTERSC